MSGYDFNRPMISIDLMEKYIAKDKQTAKQFGKIVKATDLTNIEYKTRFGRLNEDQRMKNPPSCGRFFPGFLVVRNLGSKNQYETWMPDMVFEELYEKTKQANNKKHSENKNLSVVPKIDNTLKTMNYEKIAIECENLAYRDKLRLAQLLIQLARKEEENHNPEARAGAKEKRSKKTDNGCETNTISIQYVTDRLLKLQPVKKKTLLNSIKAMYQFQGGISEKDQEAIIKKLIKQKVLKIGENNRVTYLND